MARPDRSSVSALWVPLSLPRARMFTSGQEHCSRARFTRAATQADRALRRSPESVRVCTTGDNFLRKPLGQERISRSQIAAARLMRGRLPKGCDLTRISVVRELRADHVLRM